MQINIAGFIINVTFLSSETIDVDIYKKTFAHYMDGFVVISRSKNDFEIEFKDSHSHKNYKKIKNLKEGILIQKNGKKTKIVTYYQNHISFHLLIQNALYLLLSRKDGLMIHSSSIIANNKALIFIGKSGAGKSTITKLLNPLYPILSDDMTVVRKINNKYIAFQHPLKERNTPQIKSPQGYELEGVYLLVKSKKIKFQKIVNKEIVVKRLTQQLFVADKAMIKNLLNLVDENDIFQKIYFPKDQKMVLELFNKTHE